MTATDIQRALRLKYGGSCDLMAHNIWVFKWESDTVVLQKSGYLAEFEIKISRSDFRADFKKRIRTHYVRWGNGSHMTPKHELLTTDNPVYQGVNDTVQLRRPNRFYFAVPKGMLTELDIPAHAGWVEIDHRRVTVRRKAPLLHRGKHGQEYADKILASIYHRYWCLWREVHERKTANKKEAQAECDRLNGKEA